MAKKILKENQKCRRWEIHGLLAFLVIGLTYRFIAQQIGDYSETTLSFTVYALLVLPILGLLLYLIKMELSVRITDKDIKIKQHPWSKQERRIKWKDVKDYSIVKVPEIAQWSGWNVNFNNEENYAINGRKGLHLTTKNDEEIFIGFSNLDKLKEALNQILPNK